MNVLRTVHVATTDQVARLVFDGHDEAVAGRLARRHLQRLDGFGLVRRLVDRSRDRQVGAPGYLHALTAAGLRLTAGTHALGARQRAAWRPTVAFLAHRLAISELFVQLCEHERAGGPTVREFVAEPDCWRTGTGTTGQRLLVRPDALVRLERGPVEVSWFVEVDRGSERPAVIAAKCRLHRQYELSGAEQAQYGVFPGVVFIVPGTARARALERVIAQQPAEARGLFVVTTEDAALATLTQMEGAS
ncbi:replication-relaxation family protein [Streptosporangiaceae bacterium NEAU-GS5]|nr:replication-relaxation family protein [Streptosporangiaceae bacterium NEAU-GS5]